MPSPARQTTSPCPIWHVSVVPSTSAGRNAGPVRRGGRPSGSRPDSPPLRRKPSKQPGALLAKGFVAGLQFDALFTDDLYFHIEIPPSGQLTNCGKPSLELRLSSADSPTNQIFLTVTKDSGIISTPSLSPVSGKNRTKTTRSFASRPAGPPLRERFHS